MSMKADLFEMVIFLMAISSLIFSVIIWFQFSKMKKNQKQNKEKKQNFHEYLKVQEYHTQMN